MPQDHETLSGRGTLPVGVSSTSRRADDAGLSVVGRLLIVATVAGVLIGGITAIIGAGRDPEWGGATFFFGAEIGMFCGPVVQAVNAFALFQLRPRLRPAALRLALIPLPLLGAASAAWAVLHAGAASGVWPAMLVAAGLTAVTAWTAAPWCLAPLSVPAPLV